MYTVIFSKSADKDIVNIVKYVAAENPQAAQELRDGQTYLTVSKTRICKKFRFSSPNMLSQVWSPRSR
jgi:hypothetical protein